MEDADEVDIVPRAGGVHEVAKVGGQLRVAKVIDGFRHVGLDLVKPWPDLGMGFDLIYPTSIHILPSLEWGFEFFVRLRDVEVYKLLGLSLREV